MWVGSFNLKVQRKFIKGSTKDQWRFNKGSMKVQQRLNKCSRLHQRFIRGSKVLQRFRFIKSSKIHQRFKDSQKVQMFTVQRFTKGSKVHQKVQKFTKGSTSNFHQRLKKVHQTRYLYGLDFGQGRAQTHFFDFWVGEGMLIPPRGVWSRSHDEKLQLLHFIDFRVFPSDVIPFQIHRATNIWHFPFKPW